MSVFPITPRQQMALTGISRMWDQLEDNIMTWTISQKKKKKHITIQFKGFFSFNKWSLSVEGFGLNCDAEAKHSCELFSQLNMTVLVFYDGSVLNYFLAGSCNVPDSLAQQPQTLYCRAEFLMF